MRRAILIILVLLFMPLVSAQEFASEIDINDLRRRITGEAPAHIMSYYLGDSDVSLFLTGSWKGDLQGNLGFSVSPFFGTGFISPDTPLLFKQEVDLTMSLWINERWFVEANFLNDSNLNTYRAGYQGFAGEFLQYAGVGNIGLDFPVFPYLDLGGDSPSSFGFYSRFGANDLNFHALLRYDAASKEERTFSGNRERTYSDTQPQNSIRGVSFVLPDENIDSDILVFLEDNNGTIFDTDGRRWRLALNSEYAAGRLQGLLELSIRPKGMVAVSYSKNGDTQPWTNSLADFLNEVQQWLDISSFPMLGEITIGSNPSLVIYKSGAFSVFENRSRYDAPSSTSEQAAVVRLSTGTNIGGYELVPLESNTVMDIPFFQFSLVRTDSDFNPRNPKNRWPLADNYPQVYFPGSGVFTGDLILRFTNYNSLSGYYIGTDVIPGSVQVWRSGIPDTNFRYNSFSGEVTINGPVGQNEIIRITYLKRSDGLRFGSLAAGFGAVYKNRVNPFSAQAALGIRWNMTEETFTDENMSSTGNVGFSAKALWEYDYLKSHIAAGFSLIQTDTTGIYRAAGMEGNETILFLSPDTSFVSNPPFSNLMSQELNIINRSPLVYRNYFNNTLLGSNLMYIDWTGSAIVSGINRPYPVKDLRLGDVNVISAEFILNEDENWTGFQIPLGPSAEILLRATEIEIPFRLYGFNKVPSNNFKLIIQIGSLSDRDFPFTENNILVWENNLFQTGWVYDENARIARFTLNEIDRQKLADAKSLRLIIVYEDIDEEISGRVLLAPPIARGASFRAITEKDNIIDGNSTNVTAVQDVETGSNTLFNTYGDILKKLHPVLNTQRVLRIDWNDVETGFSAGVDGRIRELPLSDYRQLSFFVKGQPKTDDGTGFLRFIIASGPDSISSPQLEAQIPLSAFDENTWRKVTIRYSGNETGITVDGGDAAGAQLIYRRADVQNSYLAFLVDPQGSKLEQNGTLHIDEIILEDSIMVYRMNAGASVGYNLPGTIVSIGNINVLEDFSVSSAVESEIREESASIVNRTGIDVSLFGAKVSGNLTFSAAEDTFLWDAEHSISKTIGSFSVKENFQASPKSNSARHTVNMAYLSDFYTRFNADSLYDFSRLRQVWNLGVGYRPKNELFPSVSINTDAVWTKRENIDENENYAGLWLKTFTPLIPDAGNGADTRRTSLKFILTQRTRPLGAVITLDGNTNFSGLNGATRTENSAFLDVPVVFNKVSFNFRAGRSFKRQHNLFGIDVFDDTELFLKDLENCLPFWSVFPGYSLFSNELNEIMNNLETALFTSFSDHYSTRINLSPIYNLSAFVIPSRINFRMERVLEQKMDTATDTLNIGGGLGFSAINMFGVMGYYPLFKFYQSDEYSHGLEAAFIIPKDEDISWRFQSAVNAGFRGFSSGALTIANTLTLRSGGYYMDSFAVNWETPTQRSLLSVFYDWVISVGTLGSIFGVNYTQLRKESLEIVLDKSTDYLRWSIIAGHEEIVRILGKLNFTSFIKLRFSEDLFTEIFTLDVVLGTTLRISF